MAHIPDVAWPELNPLSMGTKAEILHITEMELPYKPKIRKLPDYFINDGFKVFGGLWMSMHFFNCTEHMLCSEQNYIGATLAFYHLYEGWLHRGIIYYKYKQKGCCQW